MHFQIMCIKSLKIGVNRNVIIIIKIKLGPIILRAYYVLDPMLKHFTYIISFYLFT